MADKMKDFEDAMKSPSPKVAQDINSLTNTLMKMERNQQREFSSIHKSISSAAEAQSKYVKELRIKEVGYSKGVKEVDSSVRKILKKLGYVVDDLSKGTKKILTSTAKVTKDSIVQFGKKIDQELAINKQSIVALSLVKSTPIFGYFAAKFMETDVWQNMISRVKQKFSDAFKFVFEKFKLGWNKATNAIGEFFKSDKKWETIKSGLIKMKDGLVAIAKFPFQKIGQVVKATWETVKFVAKFPFKALGTAFRAVLDVTKFIVKLPFKAIAGAFKMAVAIVQAPFKLMGGAWRALKSGFSRNEKVPKMATGGYVQRGGMAEVHAAEVVTPISKLFKIIKEAFAPMEEATHDNTRRVVKELRGLRYALVGITKDWSISFSQALMKNKLFSGIVGTFSLLQNSISRFKFLFGKTSKYSSRLPKGRDTLGNTANILGIFYVDSMIRLDNIVRYLGIIGRFITGKKLKPVGVSSSGMDSGMSFGPAVAGAIGGKISIDVEKYKLKFWKAKAELAEKEKNYSLKELAQSGINSAKEGLLNEYGQIKSDPLGYAKREVSDTFSFLGKAKSKGISGRFTGISDNLKSIHQKDLDEKTKKLQHSMFASFKRIDKHTAKTASNTGGLWILTKQNTKKMFSWLFLTLPGILFGLIGKVTSAIFSLPRLIVKGIGSIFKALGWLKGEIGGLLTGQGLGGGARRRTRIDARRAARPRFLKGGMIARGAGALSLLSAGQDAFEGMDKAKEWGVGKTNAAVSSTIGGTGSGWGGAASGALKGASIGAMIGGPWGAAIGALAGGGLGAIGGERISKALSSAGNWFKGEPKKFHTGGISNKEQIAILRKDEVVVPASVVAKAAKSGIPPKDIQSGAAFAMPESVSALFDKMKEFVSTMGSSIGQKASSGFSKIVDFAKNIGPSSGFGWLSRMFESGGAGPGAISSGVGDYGGKSYGSYQFSSRTGDVSRFLRSTGYDKYFKGGVGSADFDSKWRQLASTDPNFSNAQHSYVKSKYLTPFLTKIQKDTGINLTGRHPAILEEALSTAIQYGPNSSIFSKALSGASPNISDAEILKRVGNYKIANVSSNFRSSSLAVQNSVANRIQKEIGLALGQLPGGVTESLPKAAVGGFISKDGPIYGHSGEVIGPLSQIKEVVTNALIRRKDIAEMETRDEIFRQNGMNSMSKRMNENMGKIGEMNSSGMKGMLTIVHNISNTMSSISQNNNSGSGNSNNSGPDISRILLGDVS